MLCTDKKKWTKVHFFFGGGAAPLRPPPQAALRLPQAASGCLRLPQAASRPHALRLPHAPRVETLRYDWEEAVRRVAPVLESGLKSAASGHPCPRCSVLGGLVGGRTDGLAVLGDRGGLFWAVWGVIFAPKGGLC